MRACPIPGCGLLIRNKLLLCPTHWGMVPAKLKSEVWRWYKPGQEKQPATVTTLYLAAATAPSQAVNERLAMDHDARRQMLML